MHPVLFQAGSITVYSYGAMIALGIVAGMTYLIKAGKKEAGLTFDQANTLFLLIFLAAIVGGKLLLFFENPSTYLANPKELLTGRGFVFYGSFLLAVPTMWWFFRHQKLHPYKMLDVMAITTCLVHMFGRVGCFLAGCCHGKPTDSWLGVTYTDPQCYADPLNTPLVATQLMEACYIFFVMLFLLVIRRKKRFDGQLFLSYLLLYATGRFVLEFYRGDEERGILFNILSHSQLIAIGMALVVVVIWVRWSGRGPLFPKNRRRAHEEPHDEASKL